MKDKSRATYEFKLSHDQINGESVVGRQREARKVVELPIRKRRSFKKTGTIAGVSLIAVVGVIGGFLWWQNAATIESTDDAYVDGHIINLSSRVPGIVKQVYVDDNQLVKKGDLLLELDPTDYQLKVNQDRAALLLANRQTLASSLTTKQMDISAQAQTTQASGEIAAAKAGVDAARSAVPDAEAQVSQASAELDAAKAQTLKAQKDFQRYQFLVNQGAVSKQEFDSMKTTYDVALANQQSAGDKLTQAKAKVAQAKANVIQAIGQMSKSSGMTQVAQAAKQQTQVQKEQVAVSAANVAKAQADLADAQTQLSYTKIFAPVSGRVGKKSVEIGQNVDKGQALLAVVPDQYWVTANFKETQVGRIQPGEEVNLIVDAFPGHVFKGKVDSIAPASGSEFALLPPDNATGNFTKIVQRVPVKIVFDPKSIQGFAITPGMSVVPSVVVSHAAHLL